MDAIKDTIILSHNDQLIKLELKWRKIKDESKDINYQHHFRSYYKHRSFEILGQKYLEVTVINHKPTKEVVSGPIAIVGMISSILVYICISVITVLREKRKKNEPFNK